MGFRNKAKKLNSELLILKASVLLSSPEHIRRWIKGMRKLKNFTLKILCGREGYFSPHILIHAFYNIYFFNFYQSSFQYGLERRECYKAYTRKEPSPAPPLPSSNTSSLPAATSKSLRCCFSYLPSLFPNNTLILPLWADFHFCYDLLISY